MTTLDLLILAALAAGVFIGIRSGLIKQVLGLIGLIVAFLLAFHLMQPVGAMVARSLGVSRDLAPILGFGLVFLVVEIAVFALIRLLETLIGALKLSVLNRALGGVVGVGKAAIMLSVVFLALRFMNVPTEETREEARLYAPVASVLPVTWSYATAAFPHLESLSDRFSEGLEEGISSKDDAKDN